MLNKRNPLVAAFLILSFSLFITPAFGQTLKLMNGDVVTGRYLGGTQDSIIFEVGGETKIYSIYEIDSLEFGQPLTEESPNVTTLTVPAGTLILVKLDQALTTGRTRDGERFIATLQTDIAIDGYILATRGTKFHGKVVESHKAGRIAGRASLQITLTDIVIDNQLRPLSTDTFGIEGSRSGTLAKMAAGAAIGGIADGRSGVNDGLAVGAAAAVLTSGNQIQLPEGALVEFHLLNQRTITLSD